MYGITKCLRKTHDFNKSGDLLAFHVELIDAGREGIDKSCQSKVAL